MKLPRLVLLVLLLELSDLSLYVLGHPTTELKAEFPKGSVTFSQVGNVVTISIDNQLQSLQDHKLTIHNFPVRYIGPMGEICDEKHVGKIFDPTSVIKSDYDTACSSNSSKCAIGNLTGRFMKLHQGKKVNDSSLVLSGKNSIFGRSLVISKSNGDLVSCTTIQTASVKSLVGVFRAVSPGIAGTVVLRQSAMDPDSDTSVEINLMLVDARSETKKGLALDVYTNKASSDDNEGSCSGMDKMFNPLGVTACDKRNHKTCPVGDLSAKLGPIQTVMPGTGSPRAFFIDSNLPLSGKNSIVGLTFVISENGQPLICAKIQEYQELVGEAKVDQGWIRFSQGSMYEPVMVNISTGLSARFSHYLNSKCILTNNASSWQNFKVPGRAVGLTLYGPNSVMFRPMLVNTSVAKNVCKTVRPKDPTYQLKAISNFAMNSSNSVTGVILFEQAVFNTSKAFAYISSFIFELMYLDMIKKTQNHNWHIHQLSASGVTIHEQLVSVKGHYNPYKVYVEGNDYDKTCNADFPFRCELGDLSSKLGTCSIGENFQKYFTETENYLASWHNILGRSVVIHAENKGDGRIAFADILPQKDSSYSQGSLICRNNSKTRDKTEFQNTLSKALSVASWRVAGVKFEGAKGEPNCLKYSFSLIDDSKSNLHKVFTDIIEDNSGKLKDFAPSCGDSSPGWKIDDGNVDEILGVFFGILVLVILVVVIGFWLRKSHKDEEQESKLMDRTGNAADGPAAEKPPTVIDNERDDVRVEVEPAEQSDPGGTPARKDSTKEYKLTTSL